jgi:Fe-S cluster biosynthesis and repair protein YggX
MKLTIEDIDLKYIKNYIENGPGGDAPEAVNRYLSLMDMVRGMHKRIDKYGSPEPIIKHLMTTEKLSRKKAKQIYEEALDYFYCDNYISKQAWKNIYAEKIDMLINFSMLVMKDVSDAAKIAKTIMDVWKVRELDKAEGQDIPGELLAKPFKVYNANAEALGMPRIDRNKLKALIDENVPGLTEVQKQALYREADIDGMFKAFLDEQENPR